MVWELEGPGPLLNSSKTDVVIGSRVLLVMAVVLDRFAVRLRRFRM
jgi:hypothetical protein